MFANLTTKYKILLGTGTQLLLTVILAGAALWGYASIVESNKWVDHTRSVINRSGGIMLTAVNMETGFRGYQLAGDEEFLEPYKAGSSEIYADIQKLKELVRDNPTQVSRLEGIEKTIQGWQRNVVEPSIDLRRKITASKSMSDMSVLVKKMRGSTFFDQIGKQAAMFIDREKKLLAERMNEMEAARKATGVSSEMFSERFKWVAHTHDAIERAQFVWATALGLESAMRGYLLTGDREYLDSFNNQSTSLSTAIGELSRFVADNPAQVAQMESIGATLNAWRSQAVQPLFELRAAINASSSMDTMAEFVAQKKGKSYFDTLRDQMGEFTGEEERLMASRRAEAQATNEMVRDVIIVGAIGAVVIGLMLAWTFSRTADTLRAVADNNVEISNRISTTVSELMQAISSQSTGASQQATSVNETTTTLDEIKATSQQTLDKARELSDAAEKISEQGRRGVEDIRDTISAMNEISEKVKAIAETNLSLSDQTKKIGEITAVVNAMAQESKMLALNASIEAAKAGEAGKGFAVVAGEVRKLAEQSEESTVQVQKILEEIQHATDRAVMATEEGSKQVAEGVRLVEQTGVTVESLSQIIQRTADAGEQIVAAVRQEAAGIDQITTAMTEINGVTSQFVTTTSQSKQATDNLGRVVQELTASVGALRI